MKRQPASNRSVKEPKLSPAHPPVDLDPADWQRALRRQFGRDQPFVLENRGDQAFFSEFRVSNPQSRASYRVAIRGLNAGDNYCACPDFATNALGTCKHIEFVLARLEKKRGAKAAFARGWHPAFSELYLRNDGARAVCFRAGADCPPAVMKAASKLFDVSRGGVLPEERFGELEHFLATAARGPRTTCLRRCARLCRRPARRGAAGGGPRERVPARRLRPEAGEASRGAALRYQAEGALFAVRAGRCLIGDEMGLGKTIQAIAAAEIMARLFGVERVLIVCPTSLKHQWQREIGRFTGRCGAGHRRAAGRSGRRICSADDFFKIINYDTVYRDLDLIAAWSPDLVILDEAQRIKNWNTRAARSVKKIAVPTPSSSPARRWKTGSKS